MGAVSPGPWLEPVTIRIWNESSGTWFFPICPSQTCSLIEFDFRVWVWLNWLNQTCLARPIKALNQPFFWSFLPLPDDYLAVKQTKRRSHCRTQVEIFPYLYISILANFVLSFSRPESNTWLFCLPEFFLIPSLVTLQGSCAKLHLSKILEAQMPCFFLHPLVPLGYMFSVLVKW